MFFFPNSCQPAKLLAQRLPRICKRNARKSIQGDPKRDLIRTVLYPPNVWSKDPSPTGSYRPNVLKALNANIRNRTIYETIERAWLLHQRHLRKQREDHSAHKFESMKNAMRELEEYDIHLAREANRQEDPIRRTVEDMELASKLRGAQRRVLDARLPGLFPRELRPPTDTPSIEGWNHDWKPVGSPVTRSKRS